MKSGFSIGRAFAGFLLGSFVITLLLAGAGVWWAGKQAFVRHQDAVLRSDLRAVAEAQRRLIDAHTRGLDYLARRPLVAQAVMGEERSLADLADFLRAFDIDPGILRVEIYDILLEPLIAQGIASGGRSRFPAALRRVMAEEIIESGAARLFNHARAADGEVLLIALPVESYGVAEGALVAELLMPRLLPVTEWKSIARVEIVGRHEMADLPKAGSTPVAAPVATPGAGTIEGTIEGAVADAGGERIILEIPGTSLLLAVTPDRSALGDARTHLLVTSLVALAAALSLAFLAAYVVGHQAIVGPQRALEISRRRLIASEAKAREMASIVQQTNDAIVLTDAQGRVTWCNAAVEEISGYSLAEMIGRKPGEVLQGPDTDRATTRAIGRALRARRPHRCEILNYRKTGEPYWLDLNLVPLFDSAGLIRSFVAIERDVTEAKERERQLADAREAAEAATRAKSNFLANMSHEIRTPMNGIVGMADLLSETPLGNAQALYVDTIRESASALLTIINDILDLSKVEAGRVVLAPEPVDIAQLMEEVARLLAPAATERGLEIVVDDRLNAGDGFRRIFRADRARLRQILINLAGNACKFTERGHVVLALSGPPQATGATAALTIVVRDSGIGIPADRIGDIFHAFEQADNATERRFEGTGLGLAITQRLVGLMGGTIAVTSTLGEGSVFTARLGLVEEEVVEAPAEEPRRPVRPASSPPTRTPPGGPPALRVAVVSPVAAARQLIAAQLRLEGIA
ncbi:MAG: ATP-binding protein, partial [Pseudomonadota bacterium]